ncbi:MAG: tyrosine-protein phosphatase [Bacteroidota bacterium]
MLDNINFRDIGGSLTAGGQRVRKGLLYRSGVWQKLKDADFQLVKSLSIQTIVDLRSLEEQERDPSNLPGLRKVSLPCNIDKMTRDRLKPLVFKRDADDQIIQIIDSVYADMVRLMVQPMAQIIRLILTPGSLPLLMHCRAGKDRTGVAVAMLQWFLGMEQNSILREYMKSNLFLLPKISKTHKRVRLLTLGLIPKANMQAAFEVRERYILTTFGIVEEKFGGIEAFFRSGGITNDELARLKMALLENPDEMV